MASELEIKESATPAPPGSALRAWGYLLRAPALRGSPTLGRRARRVCHKTSVSRDTHARRRSAACRAVVAYYLPVS